MMGQSAVNRCYHPEAERSKCLSTNTTRTVSTRQTSIAMQDPLVCFDASESLPTLPYRVISMAHRALGRCPGRHPTNQFVIDQRSRRIALGGPVTSQAGFNPADHHCFLVNRRASLRSIRIGTFMTEPAIDLSMGTMIIKSVNKKARGNHRVCVTAASFRDRLIGDRRRIMAL